MKSRYFELGQVVATAAVMNMMREDEDFRREVNESVKRYCNMDWGKLGEDDAQMNNEAVVNGDNRIMAAYETVAGDIWIMTEWDRSATTVLFPSDY